MITPNPELLALLRDAGHHRQTLQAYLGRRRVILETAFGPVQIDEISNVRDFVEDWTDDKPIYRSRPFRMSWLTGLDLFAVGGGGQNLILREHGEVVGGIFGKVPFVPEPHRGRGIGALMVLISDLHGERFLRPTSYSEAGFRARCAAHRDQVRLAAPWGPHEQNAHYGTGRGLRPTAPIPQAPVPEEAAPEP